MSPPILIQSCDLYKPYWPGLFYFMERHWDFGIGSEIFLCNEEEDFSLPGWCGQIKTGRGSFVENLKRAIERLQCDEVFLMLEDFWPVAPLKVELFKSLLLEFRERNLDALQVSNYTPYYAVVPSERMILGQRLMDFDPLSEWVFNFQARFWRTEKLLRCLEEPEIPERMANSAITVEIASDQKARRMGGLKVELYHHLWYPLSGVVHRGALSDFGRHLQNIVDLEKYVDDTFSLQGA